MLQRLLAASHRVRSAVAGGFALALWQCGGAERDTALDRSGQAIVGGTVVEAIDSPVLYLRGPEGACSAALVAPTLAVTARHCVAQSSAGAFSCTAAGDLILGSGGGGQIGNDLAPSSLAFYADRGSDAGALGIGSPDAVGVQILSTHTTSACRDDLAFVVLSQPIAGLVPLPVRLDTPTRVGETVSVSGYGLTSVTYDTLALRTRRGVAVVGIGPDVPSNNTQLAPVRAMRIAPVTCQGDSGGAILSATTGALVGIVSLGNLAAPGTAVCADSLVADTIGPRLAAYHELALSAFAAAAAFPMAESGPLDAGAPGDSGAAALVDASVDDGATEEAAPAPAPSSAPSVVPRDDDPQGTRVHATGASCATTPTGAGQSGLPSAVAAALAWALVGVRRRPR
ncbi:MAG: S1 family peptidase [Myxococcota bacterium]|nr:S1 family peptidase [Myxococcota bacterium]